MLEKVGLCRAEKWAPVHFVRETCFDTGTYTSGVQILVYLCPAFLLHSYEAEMKPKPVGTLRHCS